MGENLRQKVVRGRRLVAVDRTSEKAGAESPTIRPMTGFNMARSNVVLRRATEADIALLSPDAGRRTTKAWVGEIDGRIVGLGGLARINGRWIAFCELSEEARKHKRAIVRAGRHVIDEARRAGNIFIYAKADEDEPTAKRWLESLGFRPDAKTGLFRWQA